MIGQQLIKMMKGSTNVISVKFVLQSVLKKSINSLMSEHYYKTVETPTNFPILL
jgi:hypothetical protein